MLGKLNKSAVVNKRDMAGVGVILLWVFGALMVCVSTYGNYVQFVDRQIENATIWAIAFQAVCFVAQWAFKARQNWLLYVLFLVISVVPSIATYHALVTPMLAAETGSTLIAAALVWIAVIINDMAPEWIFVG